ncbi:MAG TPA: hypothetical protein VNS34_13235 [Rhizobiaceae bacterium]|nr:hypothetical protein [Rhizobiaceae bacterium]
MIEAIAEVPTWVVYAVVAACLGALGAMFSWLLEGTGQKWTRLLPIVAIGATGPVTREIVEPCLQTAGVERQFTSLRWMETLKREMPEEYDRILGELTFIPSSTTSPRDAWQKSFDIAASFRQRYASSFAKASDDILTKYLDSYLSMLKAVQSTEGSTVCAEFALKGPAALQGNQIVYQDALDEVDSLLVSAISSSLRNHQSIDPPTEDDWRSVATEFLESGRTYEEFQLLVNEDYSSPSYCGAAVGFFQAIVDIPAPPGHRIRAEIAKQLAHS